MSTKPKSSVVAERVRCAVCDHAHLDSVIKLPNLPLTGVYSQKPMSDPKGFDQELLFCKTCGHAQLAKQIDPKILYEEDYSFRTSTSDKAQKGTDFFIRVLDEVTAHTNFECVLDLGCNDTYLLKRLLGRAKKRIGIDPIWRLRENEVDDAGIQVIGQTIEEVDLGKEVKIRPDLILCRHTIEHIYDLEKALSKLVESASEDALFIFETPQFEALVTRLRFDQIFHQHVQYFTHESLCQLFQGMGASLVGSYENYHDWGAMALVFKKMKSAGDKITTPAKTRLSVELIRNRYTLFQHQMENAGQVLASLEGEIYGYGAGQMLPILAYHMKTDFSNLKSILDDDSKKNGLAYANLPLKISSVSDIQAWDKLSIAITAIDNVFPIMGKLLQVSPRHILFPFNVIS